MTDQLNLQQPRTSKIFGVIKTGANKTDLKVIGILQRKGYNEHEIQSETGVNYASVRSFMKRNDPDFKITDVPRTPENAHLYDRIDTLEKQIATDDGPPGTEPEESQSTLPVTQTVPASEARSAPQTVPVRPRGRPPKQAA